MTIKQILNFGLVLTGLIVWNGSAIAEGFDPMSTVGLYGDEPVSPESLGGIPKAQLTRAYIPDAVDFSKAMPVPVQQDMSNCVAYSVGYATRGYYASFESGQTAGTAAFTPSVAYLHSKSRSTDESCETSGASIINAMSVLHRENVPSQNAMPVQYMCQENLGLIERSNFDFRISEYSLVAERSNRTNSIPKHEIDIAKQFLSLGHPVVLSMELMVNPDHVGKKDPHTLLAYLKSEEVYQGSLDPRLKGKGTREQLTVGRHAMVAVGYDESRQAFLIQNSWSDEWSGNGFGWVSYSAFMTDVVYATVMKTKVTPPKPALRIDQPDNAQAIEGLECAYVEAEDFHGNVTGFFSSYEQKRDALKAGLSSIGSTPAFFESMSALPVRPWPVCEALLTMKDLVSSPSKPQIRMLGGQDNVAIGGSLAFEVTTPNYPAFLYLVYLQNNGSVVNLAPRNGVLRKQHPPGSKLLYGDGLEGRQNFTAQLPLGSEAILAIASRSPISQLEELEAEVEGGQFTLAEWETAKPDGKPVGDRLYLTALRAGLAEKPVSDERVLAREITADVLHLTVTDSTED